MAVKRKASRYRRAAAHDYLQHGYRDFGNSGLEIEGRWSKSTCSTLVFGGFCAPEQQNMLTRFLRLSFNIECMKS